MRIKSKRIYTKDGVKAGEFAISAGCFKFNTNQESDVIDYGDYRIIPGIIDIHNHGFRGYTLRGNDNQDLESKKAEIRGYLKALSSSGVTGVFPACSTNMIKAVAEVMLEDSEGAKILGIHSEGPWLNRVGEKGIKKAPPLPSLEVAKQMVEDGQGHLCLVALSPEIEQIEPIIRYFEANNIALSLAHTDNNFITTNEALDKYNFNQVTHLGNAMSGLHHRDIGAFGAALFRKDLMCELVCDLTHVCKEMIEIILKFKSPDLLMMVSDNSEYSLLPQGKYRVADSETIIEATKAGSLITDTGKIQGSYYPILKGIENLVHTLNIPLEDVLKMSSYNCAKKFNLSKRGAISEGNFADFIVIDDDYQVIETYVEGKKVYDAKLNRAHINDEFIKHYQLSLK